MRREKERQGLKMTQGYNLETQGLKGIDMKRLGLGFGVCMGRENTELKF